MWKRKRKRKCKGGKSIEKIWNSMKMQIIEFTKKKLSLINQAKIRQLKLISFR